MVLEYLRGAAPPVHVDHDTDETFYVLDGKVTIFVAEERTRCGPGDFVFGPRSVPHAFLVRSDWAKLLISFSPAGIDRA